jgi:glycosyltransferase involved in cell wall biosynthesis
MRVLRASGEREPRAAGGNVVEPSPRLAETALRAGPRAYIQQHARHAIDPRAPRVVTRVLICHQPVDGGVGRHIRDLANGLAQRDWEVILCAPEPLSGLEQPTTYVQLDLRRAISPRGDLAAAARLAGIVRELRPDVVHAHSSKAGAVARLARAGHPRVPLVYTPHGYAFAGYFSRRGERAAYRGVERLLAPLASRVLCVCEAEAALARSVGRSDRVRVVHNGIDVAPAGAGERRVVELARRGPVIGALTLLRPGKGLETLIDATPAVLARHPDAQVVIVGDGPELEHLRTRARLRAVAGAVHFVGHCERPLQALAAMDTFVHPSWAESFPYVILEAMTLGKPIVASDVGGIGEAIEHGVEGLLVAPRAAQPLGEALCAMLADRERATRMGERALRRVSTQFTLAAMIDHLARVYDELLRPPRALQFELQSVEPHDSDLASTATEPMRGNPT